MPAPTPTHRRARRIVRAVTVAGLVVLLPLAALWAGAAAGEQLAGATAPAGRATTTAPVATTPPTTAAPTTAAPATTAPTSTAPPSTPPPAAAGALGPDASGPAVLRLQQQLSAHGYWLGPADGTYGDLTRQAVMAFQKAEGLARDGIAGPATLDRLAGAARPSARTTHGDAIEIDLDRQLLLVVRDGRVAWALNTSTGAAATPTRPGRFEVEREIDGLRHAALGDLYRPKYFDGGIAVHGYPRVPAEAASHGCARVSYPAMDFLWSTDAGTLGTAVWVY